jgi:serpin B
MRVRILTGLVTASLLLATAAVASDRPRLGQPVTKDVPAVVNGNNAFAFDLYGRLATQDGNLFYSPYSISTALAMTHAGARGETADAMARTLHFTLPQDRLHPAFADLMARHNGDGSERRYQLYVANRLWGQRGFGFNPAYLNLTSDHYGAGLEELDFQNDTEQSRRIINAWVEQQTRDRIKDLIAPSDLPASTRLVLTNAIYFKAAWRHRFESEGAAAFRLNATDAVKVPFMHKTEDVLYRETDEFQAVSLPYQGGELNMIVLLPRKADGLKDLEKTLTAARLSELRAGMTAARVHVQLPKFRFTSTFKLRQVLSDMGMGVAFTGKADFSGMTSRSPLQISDVIHKAFIDVNEDGTEAAAATAVIVKAASAAVQELPLRDFRADRPFVFVIQDARTGSTLFAGRVANPTVQ